MTRNRPRRASVARWLADAPPYVLDCFDFGPAAEIERYDVLLTAEQSPGDGWYVPGLSLNRYGGSNWLEMTHAESRRYRRANGRRRVRWLDLPEPVRAAVVARYTAE